MRILKYITVLVTTITCVVLFNLGMDYINFGYGMHPLIAFPVATVLLVGIYFLIHLDLSECDEPINQLGRRLTEEEQHALWCEQQW